MYSKCIVEHFVRYSRIKAKLRSKRDIKHEFEFMLSIGETHFVADVVAWMEILVDTGGGEKRKC